MCVSASWFWCYWISDGKDQRANTTSNVVFNRLRIGSFGVRSMFRNDVCDACSVSLLLYWQLIPTKELKHLFYWCNGRFKVAKNTFMWVGPVWKWSSLTVYSFYPPLRLPGWAVCARSWGMWKRNNTAERQTDWFQSRNVPITAEDSSLLAM